METTEFIAGIGEILWDKFPDKKRLGGAPANFAYHAGQIAKFFQKPFTPIAISAISDDADGQELLDVLDSKGLPCQLAKVSKDYPTGVVDVKQKEGKNDYTIVENVAWDHIPFTEEMSQIARNARAVCFGTLAQRHEESRRNIHQFLASTPKECLRICDINLRGHFYTPEVLQSSLKISTILKTSDEELPLLPGLLNSTGSPTIPEVCTEDGASMTATCQAILKEFPNLRMLILTCGPKGSYVFSDGEMFSTEAPSLEKANTVGAGDSFTGTFCASLLSGKSIPEALRYATMVSAYVCTQEGAMPDMQPLLHHMREYSDEETLQWISRISQ
ncbi:MAG: carbohydrate kinase [Bacteroidales bacterium]|nr:carbohydrate kinase [Bacteroidales bacterium]